MSEHERAALERSVTVITIELPDETFATLAYLAGLANIAPAEAIAETLVAAVAQFEDTKDERRVRR